MQTSSLSSQLRYDQRPGTALPLHTQVIRNVLEPRDSRPSESMPLGAGIYTTALRQIERIEPLLIPTSFNN